MLQKIFVIRDARAEVYLMPHFVRARGEAIRSFADAVNDDKTQLSKHPEDFMLFEVGEYDDNTGVITPHEQPVAIAKAIDLYIAPDTLAS